MIAFIIGYIANMCDPAPEYGDEAKYTKAIARPEKKTSESVPRADKEEPKNQGWHQIMDKETAKPFYHNPMTGATSWDRPKGAAVVELAQTKGPGTASGRV